MAQKWIHFGRFWRKVHFWGFILVPEKKKSEKNENLTPKGSYLNYQKLDGYGPSLTPSHSHLVVWFSGWRHETKSCRKSSKKPSGYWISNGRTDRRSVISIRFVATKNGIMVINANVSYRYFLSRMHRFPNGFCFLSFCRFELWLRLLRGFWIF